MDCMFGAGCREHTTNADPLVRRSGSEPCPVPLLPSATDVPDEPKELPELITILRLGSMISGECSAGHEVVVKVRQRERHPNTRRGDYTRSQHSPDSQSNFAEEL